MRIYKYELDFDSQGNGEIKVPTDSYFLKVGVQRTPRDRIVFWYLVNPETKFDEINRFKVIMTGEEFAHGGLKYIDTVTLNGWIVCHIFIYLK